MPGRLIWDGHGRNPFPWAFVCSKPRLLTLRDGTLLCLHGSYGGGGLRAIFSTDLGKTWLSANEKWGFPVDPAVYGYAQAVELADGSVWAAYIHTGGHSAKDARTEAIWSIRLRVRP